MYSAFMQCSHREAANTNGGTFTGGAWRTRPINTEDVDSGGNMSISSNQITLDAGTYKCHITCPCYLSRQSKARLYDTTGTADLLIGTSIYPFDGFQGESVISGRFTIAVQSVLEVQHWAVANGNFGLESYADGKIEVYTIARFWKEA